MPRLTCAFAALLAVWIPGAAAGEPPGPSPSTIELVVRVRNGATPVPGAAIESGAEAAVTDVRGEARLVVPTAAATVKVSHQGFAAAGASLSAASAGVLVVQLRPLRYEEQVTVVAATRSGTMIDEQPIRVAALPQEEIEENLTLQPGTLATLFEELPGVSVQTAAPTLGGVELRLRGLRGRYSRVLVDELPIFGGEGDAFDLVQSPPLDLQQVEVITGAASSLYGGGALGGVVDLVTRRPTTGGENEPEALVGYSSLHGADAVGFLPHSLGAHWGYTLLASAHDQPAHDVDDDGWADVPGYRRGVARPRLFWEDGRGDTLLLALGGMTEKRTGGTLDDAVDPAGAPFPVRLDSRRGEAGVVGRFLIGERLLAAHASFADTTRDRHDGPAFEHDELRAGTGEVSLAGSDGAHTWVGGLGWETDAARVRNGLDHSTHALGLFGQDEVVLSPRVRAALAARAEHAGRHGDFLDPLLSVLFRPALGWQLRLATGGGHALPTPVVDESEEVGLGRVLPLDGVRAERAASASLDLGWSGGAWEWDAAVFGSRVRDALVVAPDAAQPERLRILNAAADERVHGTELLVRYSHDELHVIATHGWLDATEAEPGGGTTDAARVPRQVAELAAILENEERGRIGAELSYTGRQALDHDPYRATSPSFITWNVLGEARWREARIFLSLRNLTGVRQTHWDPLLLPLPDPTGRHTTDVWAPLDGRLIEAGIRFEM